MALSFKQQDHQQRQRQRQQQRQRLPDGQQQQSNPVERHVSVKILTSLKFCCSSSKYFNILIVESCDGSISLLFMEGLCPR